MERKGLDISNYQKGINFDAIKNSGMEFLILRAGFTGWGTGVSFNKDNCFENFYNQAKSRNIPVGAYWYSCANTYDKGVNEAKYMYENCLKGKQFEYPIYIDVEEPRHQSNNKNGVTQAIIGFCEYLENKGYYVGIYASDISGFKDKMNISQLNSYDKWVARYGSKPTYATTHGVWQYTETGRINGYNNNLDMNIAYSDYPTIIKNSGLNGFGKVQPTPQPTNDNYLGSRGYFKLGDEHPNIGKIADFMYRTFPAYTDKKALGNYYGKYIEASIKEFQRRSKAEGRYNDAIDGCVGPKTLKALESYGFKQ